MTSAASSKCPAPRGRARHTLNLHRLLGRTKELLLGASGLRDRFILKLDGVRVGGFQAVDNLRCFSNGARSAPPQMLSVCASLGESYLPWSSPPASGRVPVLGRFIAINCFPSYGPSRCHHPCRRSGHPHGRRNAS